MCMLGLGGSVDKGVAEITKLASVKFTFYSRSVSW